MTASTAARRPATGAPSGGAGARPDVAKVGNELRSKYPDLSDEQVRNGLERAGFSPEAIGRWMRGEPASKPAAPAATPPPASKGSPAKGSPAKASGPLYVSPGTPAGVLLAVIVYPAGLAYLKGGRAGLKAWFKAKFLNQTATDPGITTEAWLSPFAGAGKAVTTSFTGRRRRRTSTGDASGAGGAAVAFARTQIGKPYRYGASGPNAWDCSGLTQAAWRAAGVRIPRTTTLQLAMLPRGNRRALVAGDLIFPEPTHVQIYAGGGRIIEAPHTGLKVREEPLGQIMAVRRPRVKGTQT